MIWSIVGGAIVILGIALFFIKAKNKQKEKERLTGSNIPPEIMESFKDAEEEITRRVTNNESIDPYDIMWTIANKKRLQGGTNENGRKENIEADAIEPEPESIDESEPAATAEADIRGTSESDSPVIPAESGISADRSDEIRRAVQDRSIESAEPDGRSAGKTIGGKRGRPKGSVKYADADGNPINVFQWRKLQRDKKLNWRKK
jgi:hypothetical protein